MTVRRYAKAGLVPALLFLATVGSAMGATFTPIGTSCNSDTSDLTTSALPASNGNVGAKMYGGCSIFWESSIEGGDETAELIAFMYGTIDTDPGSTPIPMAWQFTISELSESFPADSYDWEVWALNDEINRVVLGSGTNAVLDELISGSATLSFAGLSNWNYGVTITAHLPSGSFGGFLLTIPENSLDLNAITRTTGDVPEPGSALLVVAGGLSLALFRRRS